LSKQLNKNVVKCLLEDSSTALLDRSATGKLFHAADPLTAKHPVTVTCPCPWNRQQAKA